MAKQVIRKFEAFAMHAHLDTPATYTSIFDKLKDLPADKRIYEFTADLVLAFPIVQKSKREGLFFIQAVEGGSLSALVLNTRTGGTRENILAESEMLSQATHLVVDPNSRRVAIEFVRSGAKAALIDAAIEGLIRSSYPKDGNIRLGFAPIIRENFITDINSFERIREATLRVMRPNASWTDHYTQLSDFMEESNGDKVEVGVRAGRGEALSKKDGIVKVIKEVVSDAQPYLDDATVTGMRRNEQKETTVHSKKHVTHTRESVEADEAGVPVAADIRNKLASFLSKLTGGS